MTQKNSNCFPLPVFETVTENSSSISSSPKPSSMTSSTPLSSSRPYSVSIGSSEAEKCTKISSSSPNSLDKYTSQSPSLSLSVHPSGGPPFAVSDCSYDSASCLISALKIADNRALSDEEDKEEVVVTTPSLSSDDDDEPASALNDLLPKNLPLPPILTPPRSSLLL